jgi:tRNA G18 (ribose-2'-O)-methylase SpoU
MGATIAIDDPSDPRLHDYTDLTDVELRRRREPAEGLFIAEGEKVIGRALRAGYRMRSMLLSAKWLETMREVVEADPAPVYVVAPEVAERVTGFHIHRGALAAMERKPLPDAAALLPGTGGDGEGAAQRRVAIFEDMVSHTNLGAAFRSAAALGVEAVFLTPRCADPLYRRSVRVSMGAVFTVPYARLEHWPQDAGVFRERGFVLAALCLSERSITLDELVGRRYERLALMLGTEGEGLSARALSAADEHVRIPMDAGVDSLNVAAASAVAFYATRPRPA